MKKYINIIIKKISGLFVKKSIWTKLIEGISGLFFKKKPFLNTCCGNISKFVSEKRKTSILIGVILLLLIIGLVVKTSFYGGHWLCVNNAWVKSGNPTSVPPAIGCGANTKSINFVISGVLAKNNPGMKSGVFYLNYNRPGASDLSAELIFGKDLDSSSFKTGQRVFIEGFEQDNKIIVKNITPERSLPEAQQIKVYFYNSTLDTDKNGKSLCGKKGLVAVNRPISKTTNPVPSAIRLLLLGKVSPREKTQGLSTDFPLTGLTFVNSKLESGVLTITLSDPQKKTSASTCRASILKAEIEATAMQFPEVKSVKFSPSTLF